MSKKNKVVKYDQVEVKDNMNVNNTGGDSDIREERKSLDSIVSVQPKKVKRGLASRLVSGVLGPEGLPGIGAYVSEEIIMPAIKHIIVDSVTSAINKAVYGDSSGQTPRNYGGGQPYSRYNSGTHRPTVNYSSRYTSQQPEPATIRPQRGTGQGVEEYLIIERADALHVLTTLTEQADMYGSVSVADYYDLIGITSEYTDNNYGWFFESIAHASIRPVRGGHVIKFPPTEVI